MVRWVGKLKIVAAAIAAVLVAALAPTTPAMAATSHMSDPITCNDGLYIFHMVVWYSTDTNHRLSINQVKLYAAYNPNDAHTGSEIAFRGAAVARHYMSDGWYYRNTTGAINQKEILFYWPIANHTTSKSAPAYVDVQAVFYDSQGHAITTDTCRAGFYN
jgi:hypothetical protein